MALPVVIVPSGGYPMNRLSAHGGLPVTLAAQGLAVTEAPAGYGTPMTFVTEGGSVVLPVPPVTYPTWSTTDFVFVTLTNSNLTATSNSGTQNAGVRAASSKATSTSGKFYLEFTVTTWAQASTGVGLSLAATPLGNLWNAPTGCVMVYRNGTVYLNGSPIGTSLGTRASGNVIGLAVDLGLNQVWFRVAPAGNWNGSGTANPATPLGGHSLTPIAGALFPAFGCAVINERVMANFGATAFVGAVPSDFTAGWPT